MNLRSRPLLSPGERTAMPTNGPLVPGGAASLAVLDRLSSSYLILAALAGIGVAAGVLYRIGFVGLVLRLLGAAIRGSVRNGFHVWRELFSWARWPVYLGLTLALIALGWAASRGLPGL